MSDPDENSSPIPLLTKDAEGEGEPIPVEELEKEEVVETTMTDDYTQNYTPSEQPQTQHLLQPSSPSSQQQDQSIQPLTQPLTQPPKSQNQSLEILQLKIATDKNFSKKITLHTFFSYVILAIELQRTADHHHHSPAPAGAVAISVNEVETLIEYMIENHSASEEIRTYLHTLNTNGIIRNMILAVIDFNKEENKSLDKLFISEQIELEMTVLQEETTTTNSGQALVDNTTPQTPQSRGGFFKCMRRFFSGCCG
jgi:hypothetical protein